MSLPELAKKAQSGMLLIVLFLKCNTVIHGIIILIILFIDYIIVFFDV